MLIGEYGIRVGISGDPVSIADLDDLMGAVEGIAAHAIDELKDAAAAARVPDNVALEASFLSPLSG